VVAEPSTSEPCCACGTCCCPVFDSVLIDGRSEDAPSVPALDSNAFSSVDNSLTSGKHNKEAHLHILNI